MPEPGATAGAHVRSIRRQRGLQLKVQSRLCWLAVIFVLLLALCSCQVGGTRPIIKIGLSAPFSGFDETVGYSLIGVVRLAIRERNLAGGVAGYRVELVALDDGNDAATAAQRAREMIIDPAIMAVLGGFDAQGALVAAVEYERAAMPFVTLATSDALHGRAFSLLGSQTEAGRQAGTFATRDLGARRIAMISERVAGENGLDNAFAASAQAGGATIVYRTTVDRWQLDFAAICSGMDTASPDLVFFDGRAAEAGELLRQMRAVGQKAAFLGGPGVDDARFAQIAGPAAQGAHYVSLGFALSQVADMATRDHLALAGLRPASAYTVLAYDGTQLVLDALEQAIKKNGKPARAAVAEQIRSSHHAGLSGEIAFDQDGSRQMAAVSIVRVADQ